MQDVASLKIAIQTGEIKTANTELDKLTKTSARTEQSANKVTSSFFSLGRVLSSMALLATTQQFIKMADTMTGVESKLKLVTNNTLDLIVAQQELFKIAQTTRQGFAETVDTYSNFAVAMGEMGKSQKEILRVTETVNKAIAISGGTAQQAAAATMQLGQAFASGTLRGDELNSILENSKGLAQAIADGMGVPIGKLRTLGSEGKITAEILANALDKSAKSVDDKFSKVGITVDASMTVLANSITNMIGKVDKQLGTTGYLGKLITDVSKHIDENTQDWVDSVQEAMDTMYPVAEAGFTNIRDLSEVTFEGVNALFSVMVHAFDGAVDSMNDKYRELGFFDYMSLGFIVVIEGFRQIASGGLSALTFLGKQFNTFQAIALDAIAGVMGAMGKFQNSVGGDGSSFLEAQTFWANKANKVKQDGILIDRTQKAILDDMGKGVDRLIGSYDKLALKKVKAKKVDTDTGDTGSGKKGGATAETEEQKKAQKEAERLAEEQRKRDKEDSDFALQTAIEANQKRKALLDEEAKLQADSALAFYDLIKTDAEKVNEKFLSLYEQNKDLFSTDQLALFFDKWNKSLDDTFEKVKEMEFSSSIEFDPQGLDDTAKSIAGIGKQLDQLTKAEKQYQENKALDGATQEQIAENEAQHTKDQITGYSNIAGAMSSMFAQGSREAEAFKAVQSGLALINAVTAVMNAGTNGDGYTAVARMAAVAAYASQMLGSIGLALNSGGGSTSSDALASQNANTGAGSILGDTTAQSESIANSMEILGDLAKPEFALMSQMNKSLISIDQKIAGVSAKILQESGFAVGEGFVGSNRSSSAVSEINSRIDKTLSIIEKSPLNIGGIMSNAFLGSGAALISKLATGLFGKTTVGLKDAGITFGDQFLQGAMSSLTGNSYQVVETIKKSWFSKSTTLSTGFSALDDYTKNQFQLILGNIYDVVDISGEALGVASTDVDTQLNSFVVSLGKISLLGKTGDEINTTLTAIFGKVGDDLATKVFPAMVDFQTVGEGMFETMTRVATGMEEANYYVDRLGKQFTQTIYTAIGDKQGDIGLEALRQSILGLEISGGVSDIIRTLNGDVEELYDTYTSLDLLRFDLSAIGTSTDALTSSMLYGAGGITALSDATQSYIENYLSESEQLAYNTSIMTDAFSDLGLTIPTTKQGFTDLLKSIDVTTDSGQDLYGRLILLSDGFNELTDSADSIKSSLFDNIKSFIDSIGIKNTSDAPKAFSDFSTSFNSMIDAIANGSGDLLEVGNTALDNAQNYLNVVTATATAGRDIEFARAMLVNKFSGVIATPEMTLSTINSTLIQNNQTLVSELQSLKFELQSIKQMSITQTSTQIKTLSTQRALLGEITA